MQTKRKKTKAFSTQYFLCFKKLASVMVFLFFCSEVQAGLPPAILKCGRVFLSQSEKAVGDQSNQDQQGKIARSKLPPKFRKYSNILKHGIKNSRDLVLLDELFRLIEPDDGGVLAQKAAQIPHEFVPDESSTLGAAKLTFSRVIERVNENDAEKILLSTGSKMGASPFVVKHERVHGVSYLKLPKIYQIPLPAIPRQGSLVSIFKAILENRFLDEAMAFSSEVFLENNFRKATGLSLLAFKPQADLRLGHLELQKAYFENGMQGLFDYVSQVDSYQSYRIGALYLAFLVKKGMTDFPNWKDLLKESGVREVQGGLSIDPATVMHFFETQIKPLLGKNKLSIAMFMMGLSGKQKDLLAKASRFFTAQMTKEEGAAFLRNDFDQVVDFLGKIMGDGKESLPAKPVSPAKPLLPDHQKEPIVQPAAAPRGYKKNEPRIVRTTTKDERLADRIEIMGKFAEFLTKLDKSTENVFEEHLDTYLEFAVHTDAKTADRIFARLLDPVRKSKFSKRKLVQIAVALMKTERGQEGERMYREAIESKGNDWPYSKYLAESEIKYFISTGRDHLIQLALEKQFEHSQEELRQFRQEGLAPIDFFDTNGGIITRIHELIESILKSYDESQVQIPNRLRKRIESISSQLWADLLTWTRNKIARYERTYAPDIKYSSIDELTAVNPQWGGKSNIDDLSRLVGIYNSSQNMGLEWFTNPFLTHPQLSRFGLRMLNDQPDSTLKLASFSTAAKNLPKDFTDSERMEFIQSYSNCIEAVKIGFAQWNYLYGSDVKTREPGTQISAISINHYKKSFLYWQALHNFIQISFESTDAQIQARGIDYLFSLTSDANGYPGPFSFDGKNLDLSFPLQFKHFRPNFFKAASFFDFLGQLNSHGLGREALDEIYDDVFKNGTLHDIDYSTLQVVLYVKLLKESLRLGHVDLYQKYKKRLADFPLLSPDIAGNVGQPKEIIPFLEIVANKGQGLTDLVERVKADVTNKRKQFELKYLLKGLNFLSEPEIFAAIQRDSQAIMDLSKSVIDLYIQSIGQRGYKEYFPVDWEPLVKTLRETPLNDYDKDDLFTYLVEKSTPEPGALGGHSNQDGVANLWDGFQVLDFLLGNPKTPSAEAALIARLVAPVRNMQFNREDPRIYGALKALAWVYKRLKTPEILDPENKPQFARLRNTRAFKEALTYLHILSVDETPKKLPRDVLVDYEKAVATNQVQPLHEVKPSLVEVIATEVNLAMEHLRGTAGRIVSETLSVEDLKKTTLYRVFQDWQMAKSLGDTRRADKIFDILATSGDVSEIVAKQSLYYQILSSQISIKEKRRLFFEISRTPIVSAYVKAAWKEVMKKGISEAEELFYRATIPYFKGGYYLAPKNELIGMATQLTLSEMKQYVRTYETFLKNPSDEWEFDPLDEFAWEIYSSVELNSSFGNWETKMSSIYDVFLGFKQGYWGGDKIEHPPFYQKKQNSRHLLMNMRDLKEKKNVDEMFSRKPSEKEFDIAMAKFKRISDRREKAVDKVKMSGFVMPEIFGDQPPLVQFMLSRFFMQFPIGERQELLLAMKGATKGDALRMFFEKTHLEKVGQFLSVWPEVPVETQKELALLQERNAKSDFEEVKGVISTEIPNQEIAQFIIAHLEPEPLGVGTIGEVYKSKLPNGRVVVVKVITRSKESNFLSTLDKVNQVKSLLRLYQAELPYANEAIRFIEMFQSMTKKELELQNEVQNAQQFQKLFGETFEVPHHFVEYSSSKVEVQEFLDGSRLANVSAKVKSAALIELKGHFMLEQVAKHGFYGSDFQPGNIQISSKNRTQLIDFGQMGVLTLEERRHVTSFVQAYQLQQETKMVSVLEKMGIKTQIYNSQKAKQLEKHLQQLIHKDQGQEISRAISEVFRLCNDAGLIIDLSYLQLVKGLATLEGTLKSALN